MVAILFQALFYVTPIFYTRNSSRQIPAAALLAILFFYFVQCFRSPIYYSTFPPARLFLTALALTAATFAAGFFLFIQKEKYFVYPPLLIERTPMDRDIDPRTSRVGQIPSGLRRSSGARAGPGFRSLSRKKRKEFWALEDITSKFKTGEIFGVIGSNAAGKSTLLKAIAGIFPPTAGDISVHGTSLPSSSSAPPSTRNSRAPRTSLSPGPSTGYPGE